MKNIKNLYSRLNNQQKEKYYQELLSASANTDCVVHSVNQSDFQTDGNTTARLIFEAPLSAKTYIKVKSLVTTMNKQGNGIRNTKTESKKLINTLLQNKQITQQQANELLKAGNIQ